MTTTTIKAPSKMEKCLLEFLKRGTEGIHTLDVQIHNKHHADNQSSVGAFWTSCLNSDVSYLKNEKGIAIARKTEQYKSKDGHVSNFKRYWLPDRDEARKALILTNHYRRKRKAAPLTQKEFAFYLTNFPSK